MTLSATADDYRESEARLNETGALLGEMAAMLSDVADCMSHEPALFARSVSAAEWPSFERLQAMTATWLDRREELMLVWRALSEEDRVIIGPLPDFDAPDPSIAVV
jgi:hypothetical protein